MLFNIGVTSYNRLASTKACLESVLRCRDKNTATLTVVDNGSTDGSREYLKALRDQGKIDTLFLFKRNMGVSCAANQAWAASDAAFFVKLDNDMVVLDKRWLEPLRAVASDSAVGVAAYDVYGHDGPPARLPSGRVVRPGTFCGGSCAMIRRGVHRRMGFWCEDYGLYGEEDSDMGGRMVLAGLVNAYVDNPGMVRHDHGAYKADEHLLFKPRKARRKNVFTLNFNLNLYTKGIRPLYVGRKYLPFPSGEFLVLRPDPEYLEAMAPLRQAFASFSARIHDKVDSYIDAQE